LLLQLIIQSLLVGYLIQATSKSTATPFTNKQNWHFLGNKNESRHVVPTQAKYRYAASLASVSMVIGLTSQMVKTRLWGVALLLAILALLSLGRHELCWMTLKLLQTYPKEGLCLYILCQCYDSSYIVGEKYKPMFRNFNTYTSNICRGRTISHPICFKY
jgi:hypothetical protein